MKVGEMIAEGTPEVVEAGCAQICEDSGGRGKQSKKKKKKKSKKKKKKQQNSEL
eukprot:COSAG06_NODE_1916_length_8071_cov_3.562970_3_plen_54_part_00